MYSPRGPRVSRHTCLQTKAALLCAESLASFAKDAPPAPALGCLMPSAVAGQEAVSMVVSMARQQEHARELAQRHHQWATEDKQRQRVSGGQAHVQVNTKQQRQVHCQPAAAGVEPPVPGFKTVMCVGLVGSGDEAHVTGHTRLTYIQELAVEHAYVAVPVEPAQPQGLFVVYDWSTVLRDEFILAEGPCSPQAVPATCSSSRPTGRVRWAVACRCAAAAFMGNHQAGPQPAGSGSVNGMPEWLAESSYK